MTPSRRATAVAALVLVLAAPARRSHAGDDLPSWARDAVAAPVPAGSEPDGAVVLLRANTIEISGSDTYVERERRVVRILSRAGSPRAYAVAEYRTDGGKVRFLKAWIVSPSGTARQIPGKETADLSLAGNDMVSESRARLISGKSDAVPGATFVWESEVERRSPFGQFEWYFQDDLPTVRSEFAFRPLPGWTVDATILNGDSVPAAVANGWWRWTRSGLSSIRHEDYLPPLSSLATRLIIDASPPPGEVEGSMRSFARWEDVATWLYRAAEANGAATHAIAAKARTLTATATTNEQRIRAVAEYCQSVNYVSIQMGLSRGGGYVPHAADDVLRKGYGDCKDKSNLMRAMLRSLGIEAYLCAVSASDPDYVRDSWPTPGQFNHCIVAVRSDDSAASAISSGSLGRLVLFDPTDPSTRWGHVPESEQGGLALIVAPAGGELVRVPVAPAARSRNLRRFEATVAPDGSVSGIVSVLATGTSASWWRATSRTRGAGGLASEPELWLSSKASAAVIDSFAESLPGDDSYRIRANFRIPRFGRAIGGNVLVLETGKLTSLEVALPAEKTRAVPMMVPRFAGEDELRLTLPEGYGVEDIPAPVTIEASYGSYSASFRVEGGDVVIQRRAEFSRTLVPAARSAEVRDFLLRVERALGTPLVLAKQ